MPPDDKTENGKRITTNQSKKEGTYVLSFSKKKAPKGQKEEDSMLFLNIHGYHGCWNNGAYHALRKQADPLGAEVLSPVIDYDAEDARAVFDRLSDVVEREKPDLIAGTSLGGFFAALLCGRYRIPAILVNPCLLPFLHLPRLDYPGDIHKYMALFDGLSAVRPADTFVLIGGKDEIIDTHDFAHALLDDGGHFYFFPDGFHESTTLGLDETFSGIMRSLF